MSDESNSPESSESTNSESLASKFLKPKKPKRPAAPAPERTVEIIPEAERPAKMKSLNDLERKLGFAASALVIVFGAVLNLPFMFGRHEYTLTKTPNHGHCPPNYSLIKHTCVTATSYDFAAFFFLIIGAGIAMLIAVAANRRTPAAFLSLLAGLVITNEPPNHPLLLGAPFLFFGGWLLLRARRIQKFGTTDSREVAAISGEMRRARKNGTTPTRSTSPGRRTPAAKTTPEKKIETGRYTPKRPAPKKTAPPPPEPKVQRSWFDRKTEI